MRVVRCPKCGLRVAYIDGLCFACGARLPKPAPQPAPENVPGPLKARPEPAPYRPPMPGSPPEGNIPVMADPATQGQMVPSEEIPAPPDATPETPAPPVKKVNSVLGIWAFIASFVLPPVGLILGIIDLARRDTTKKHGFSIAAIVISVIMGTLMMFTARFYEDIMNKLAEISDGNFGKYYEDFYYDYENEEDEDEPYYDDTDYNAADDTDQEVTDSDTYDDTSDEATEDAVSGSSSVYPGDSYPDEDGSASDSSSDSSSSATPDNDTRSGSSSSGNSASGNRASGIEDLPVITEDDNDNSIDLLDEPDFTKPQKDAVKDAGHHIAEEPFSRQGLIDRLTGSDGYSVSDAETAVDYLEENSLVDWYVEADRAGKAYGESGSYTEEQITDHLIGMGFPQDEAEYGAAGNSTAEDE